MCILSLFSQAAAKQATQKKKAPPPPKDVEEESSEEESSDGEEEVSYLLNILVHSEHLRYFQRDFKWFLCFSFAGCST